MPNTISYAEALKKYKPDINRPAVCEETEEDALLKKYHPDFDQDSIVKLQVGPNRGDRCHRKIADLLQSDARIEEADLKNAKVVETDVLVIGGGGAGCAAAITAAQAGARVSLSTKLRLGDSNTIMAEGGIQASIEKGDTPQIHFDDTYRAGHYQGEKALIEQLVRDGPSVIQWLIQQGMQFDTNAAGDLLTRRAGGTTADRVVYYRDYTGLEMIRVLREAVFTSNIKVCSYNPVVELLSNDQGDCVGAVLCSVEDSSYMLVKANAVILATGGIGRTHLNGFLTSNHLGATGDGLVLAYRLGAKLCDLDSFQYHPSGLAYPQTLAGTLITEGVRSAGAQLLNVNGERFIGELKPRDVVAAAIIRECAEGRGVQVDEENSGVWLDTPTLELQQPGILNSRFPKLVELGKKSGIDLHHSPMLIYPTLHYQNGGVTIDKNSETTVPGLYCAGELSGGIHGKNRIMGNALLEIISFGRRAGAHAAARHKDVRDSQASVDHLHNLKQTLDNAGISGNIKGPILFPDYTGFNL